MLNIEERLEEAAAVCVIAGLLLPFCSLTSGSRPGGKQRTLSAIDANVACIQRINDYRSFCFSRHSCPTYSPFWAPSFPHAGAVLVLDGWADTGSEHSARQRTRASRLSCHLQTSEDGLRRSAASLVLQVLRRSGDVWFLAQGTL